MASIGGSVEEHIAKKLRLNELLKVEQVKAVLNYFITIINGEIKSTPPELKGLLNIMYEKLIDDEEALITKYIMLHETDIIAFFNRNFQRFNYYEFKHQLMLLKGELPGEEYQVPVNEKRNFEKIEPLDITPYAEILENNPIDLKIKQKKTITADIETLTGNKNKEARIFTEKLTELKEKINKNIQTGVITRADLSKSIQFAEEMCVPALQMKYNKKAIEKLNAIFIEEQNTTEVVQLFDSLKMSAALREKFYQVLYNKVAK